MFNKFFFVALLCFSPIVFSDELHEAAKQGNLELAQSLLKNGAEVDVPDGDGYTPLHLAAQFGHLGVVQLLSQYGAEVNVYNIHHYTPLHLAAQFGHLAVAQFLSQHGATVNVVTNAFNAPLHLAALSGNLAVAQFLFFIGPGAAVNAPNIAGNTPLHFAAQFGHPVIIQFFIANGATVNVANNAGNTPLHLAAQFGHPEGVQSLLEVGADSTLGNGNGHTAQNVATVACAEVIQSWLQRPNFLRMPLEPNPLHLVHFRGSPGNLFFNVQLKEGYGLLGILMAMDKHSLNTDMKWEILKFLTFGDFFALPKGLLKKHRDPEDDGKGGPGGAWGRSQSLTQC